MNETDGFVVKYGPALIAWKGWPTNSNATTSQSPEGVSRSTVDGDRRIRKNVDVELGRGFGFLRVSNQRCGVILCVAPLRFPPLQRRCLTGGKCYACFFHAG